MTTKNKYDEIDFCLNTLYDFYYNINENKCYKFKPIIKNQITINDIKKQVNFQPDDILKSKLTFIDKYNGKWYFKRSSPTSYPCILCIGKYDMKNSNFNDMGRGELINMAYHYILSEIIDKNFNHTLLPIMNFDIDYDTLKKNNDIFEKYIEKDSTDASSINSNYYVNILENYNPTETLRKYLLDNYKNIDTQQWRVIIFQILFALYKISLKMKNFRHNELNLDSIFVVANNKSGTNTAYKIGFIEFSVPNFGFDIKITNFNKSNSDDYFKNKSINKYSENPYYDVHYILQHILFFISDNNYKNDELIKFIYEIIPENIRANDKNTFDGLDEFMFEFMPLNYILPSNILKKNNFFTHFIIKNMDLSTSPMSDEIVNLSRLNNRESIIDYSFNSPTDVSDEPRMLGRNINYKKKTYINNNSMVKGSRKLNKPRILNEYSISENDIFEQAEKAYNSSLGSDKFMSRMNKNSNDDNSDNNDTEEIDEIEEEYRGIYDENEQEKEFELERMKSQIEKKYNKTSESSISDKHDKKQKESSKHKNYEESSVSDKHDKKNRDSKKHKNYEENSVSDKHDKKNRDSKKHKNYEESSVSDKHDKKNKEFKKYKNYEESSVSGKKNDDTSEITLSSSDDKDVQLPGINKGIPYTDNITQNILNKLPEGYIGELPEHLKYSLPQMNTGYSQYGMNNMLPQYGTNQMIPQMGNDMMNQMSQLPQLPQVQQLSQLPQLPQMPQMSQMSQMPQMSQFPSLPQSSIGSAGMKNQNQLPMIDPTMMSNMGGQNMNYMSQGIPGMNQMGGKKKVSKKTYKLDDDFFF